MKLLRIKRENFGWSRAELARRAGMNGVTVGQIENSRLNPYPGQLEKLAIALGMPAARAAELLLEEPAPTGVASVGA